jgi:phytoene dehydrogenase-like protein
MDYDAVVVGSGPNGLSAAIQVARHGHSVVVLEAAPTLGGGLRSAELTLPGFQHDVCAAVLPLTIGSPFLSRLPLADFGLDLLQPPLALAHPLDDGSAVVLERSVSRTAAGLGVDGAAYTRLIQPSVAAWQQLLKQLLGPFRLPRHPVSLARFGIAAILPAAFLCRVVFRHPAARALMGGLSAHSILPLERPASAAFGLVLAVLGHAVGWPMPRGGARRVSGALLGYLTSLGGQTRGECPVGSLAGLPRSQTTLLDLTPRQVLSVAGDALSLGYRRQLGRYRYGPGVFKVDWALQEAIPWTATACRAAGTVHVGGTLDEIAASERAVWHGQVSPQPFVVLAQPSIVDASRAPAGRHTAWAYCHVPHGSRVDMAQAIEAQIERFAPGFSQRILARATRNAAELQAYNANYIGGDINGGVQDLLQLWTRPSWRPNPYSTSDPRLFICSSATPPGGGVHGMCGYHAGRAALQRLRSHA